MLQNPPAPDGVTVARVITRLNIGGPSIQAVRLTTALEPYGFSTVLFHGRLGAGEGDMSYLVPAGTDARFVPTLCRPLSPIDDLRTLVRLYREFRRLRPRIVHTHMAKAGMLGRLAAAAYNLSRGRAPRARIVHTYHGHVLDGYFSAGATRLFIGLERGLARLSDRLIAISPAIRAELVQHYRIGRDRQYCVVPLGFDLSTFAAVNDATRAAARLALNIADHVPVIATVGRLTAIKQPRLFLDVVRLVARHHPRVIALVAGDGELRGDVESYAAELGISDRVRLLGWRKDLATIYAATDVFLLTSRNEGTPVALIEAMASGTPGVSTDVGGVKDVVESDAVGVLVPAGDATALAVAVSALLAEPHRRKPMGAAARAAVLQRYSLDRLTADVRTVYDHLISEH